MREEGVSCRPAFRRFETRRQLVAVGVLKGEAGGGHGVSGWEFPMLRIHPSFVHNGILTR